MTAHLSPGVVRGLRLVTIGIGLLSGLLASRADAQQCAPAPIPQLAASTHGGQAAGVPRTLGDPLVITNPRIEIFRATPDPEPEELGSSQSGANRSHRPKFPQTGLGTRPASAANRSSSSFCHASRCACRTRHASLGIAGFSAI